MNIVYGIIIESFFLLKSMSVYLLFGYLFAGILHIYLRPQTIAKHLGTHSFAAVCKASLFGIPLPLCSCGVIPAALSLRKEGASKGAMLSFLVSTPTTGIDSIFATFALLGGVFTAYRVVASFVAALVVGLLANIFLEREVDNTRKEKRQECVMCEKEHSHSEHTVRERLSGMTQYAFSTLLKDSGEWLLIGIFIGGTIAYFIPPSFIENSIGAGWQAIVIMFFIGMPMYVCASGSIPIAAALMLKGLNPGAAFAFLLAGPATNTVTMSMVLKSLGKKALCIYLGTIALCSFAMGVSLDYVWAYLGINALHEATEHAMLFPAWVEYSATVLLILLILFNSNVFQKIILHKK